MQLADRGGPVAGLPQAVVPTRNAAIISDPVVPEPDVMDVAPSRQRGARRHANWGVAIGVTEPHALRREAVEVRRPDHRMARATEYARVMLVRQNKKEVRGLHLSSQCEGPPPASLRSIP